MEPNQIAGQNTQDGGKMKTVWSVVVLVIVIAAGWYAYKAGWFGGGITNAPEISQEQLIGKEPLSTGQVDSITKHKQEILDRIAQGAPLTEVERQELGRLMLMEAHLYNFTKAETDAIFNALKQ
jgi:hypothetical protein